MVTTLRISPNHSDAYDVTQSNVSYLEKEENSADSFFNMCDSGLHFQYGKIHIEFFSIPSQSKDAFPLFCSFKK